MHLLFNENEFSCKPFQWHSVSIASAKYLWKYPIFMSRGFLFSSLKQCFFQVFELNLVWEVSTAYTSYKEVDRVLLCTYEMRVTTLCYRIACDLTCHVTSLCSFLIVLVTLWSVEGPFWYSWVIIKLMVTGVSHTECKHSLAVLWSGTLTTWIYP